MKDKLAAHRKKTNKELNKITLQPVDCVFHRGADLDPDPHGSAYFGTTGSGSAFFSGSGSRVSFLGVNMGIFT